MNNGTLAVEKVTPIESKQPQAQCQLHDQATLRGFPVTIEGEGSAGDLKIIVDRLFDLGAEPPAASEARADEAEPAPRSALPTTRR